MSIMKDDIYHATEELKCLLICGKCQKLCEVPNRIKLCGHIYCQDCIQLNGNCFQCGKQFFKDNVFVDNSLQIISNGINHVASKLVDINLDLVDQDNSINTSCIVHEPDQNESRHILEYNSVEDRIIDFDCNCANYVSYKYKPNQVAIIDKKNAVGETKLHRACKKNNETEVESLINSGASVNAQDYAHWTPLHEAIIVGNEKIVEWLIEKGSVVNAPGFNYDTPLHKAIVQKNIKIATLLVEHGANLHSKNYEGTSPWDLADSDTRFTLNKFSGSFQLQIPIQIDNFNIYVIGELTEELNNNIRKLSKAISINIMDQLNEQVTHVITVSTSKLAKPSFELFLAILYCIPVISSEWLQACVTLRSIVDYKEYFIIGTDQFQYNVIQCSQINKFKLNPRLFSGCYIHLGKCNKFTLPETDIIFNAKQVTSLIEAGGGTLLKREPSPGSLSGIRRPWYAAEGGSLMNCAHYILYDPAVQPELRYNMRELRHVPYHWIFESALRYQLIVPEQLFYKQN